MNPELQDAISVQATRVKEQMAARGWSRAIDALPLLCDRDTPAAIRVDAADVLGHFRERAAVLPLVEALAEGDRSLSWTCSYALNSIVSRRHGRRLIAIARDPSTLDAQQAAIYSLWLLGETRAEAVLIRIAENVDGQNEHSRSMATEALGNTSGRRRSQRALARRLFDPSVDVRYSALCALGSHLQYPPYLVEALKAKTQDPGQLSHGRVIATFAQELLVRQMQDY